MKRVIIPDTHLDIDWFEKIVELEKPDLIISLGDIFDAFQETERKNTQRTARWLKHSLRQENRIHLFGNHDIYYAYNSSSSRNAGFTELKNTIINSIIKTRDWDRFKWFYIFEDGGKKFICTHAGLSKLLIGDNNPESYLTQNMWYATMALQKSEYHEFWKIGPTHGARTLCGGITWCRPEMEFVGISGYHQFFGHTFQGLGNFRNFFIDGSDNFCLDGSQTTYAVVENGKVEIKVIDK